MAKARAVIESNYPEDVARAIAEALQPDNVSAKGTKITTRRKGGLVTTRVESPSIEKLLPIVDDILSCQALCEKTIDLARGHGRQRWPAS